MEQCSEEKRELQVWELRKMFDPWQTALGKAYLHLFNQISDAMTMMEQKNFLVVEGMLLNAQRRAEEILLDYNHPLDFYVEEAKGRVK